MRTWALGILAALATTFAHAQGDYPAAPIRVVNISSAGAGGDAIARLVTDRMALILKGTFVMDNRPGAGGAIAADAVAKARPDGYTLLFGGFTSNVLLAATRPTLSYDPAKDFDPVGQIGTASPEAFAAVMRERDASCPMGRQGTSRDVANAASSSPPTMRPTSPACCSSSTAAALFRSATP